MNRFITVLVCAAAGLGVAYLIAGSFTTISVLAGIGIGIVLGLVIAAKLFAQATGEETATVIKKMADQVRPDPDAKERAVREPLTQLNEKVRLDGNLESDLVGQVEGIIDQVFEVYPKALEKASGSETTYEIGKLGTDWLPTTVNRFLALAVETRDAQVAALREQLTKIKERLASMNEKLEAGLTDEFDAHDRFMDIKFD